MNEFQVKVGFHDWQNTKNSGYSCGKKTCSECEWCMLLWMLRFGQNLISSLYTFGNLVKLCITIVVSLGLSLLCFSTGFVSCYLVFAQNGFSISQSTIDGSLGTYIGPNKGYLIPKDKYVLTHGPPHHTHPCKTYSINLPLSLEW